MTIIDDLMGTATSLNDDEFEQLKSRVDTESARRKTIKEGLDPGEQLQLATLIEMIQQRTGVKESDARGMVLAHPLQQRPSPMMAKRRT